MSNGIYLTLEQYKDKDLPLTITVNGNTYHSQFALATAQTTYFEMGKQQGMELSADNTYSDKEMSRMHDAWYDAGYEAGKKSITQEEFDRGWAYGYDEGKEEGKSAGYDAGYEEGFEIGKRE
jgi:flagellar biosynthesis/type III secretory pathway protein FliH